MYGKQENIRRFLAMADIYFRLTGKSASDMRATEMEEFYACIKNSASPDEFKHLIAARINRERRKREEVENSHCGEWGLLPPAQRVM